jgi:hypothetical protein
MEVKIEGHKKHIAFFSKVLPSIVTQCGLHRSKAACLVKFTHDIPQTADGQECDGMAMYVEMADCYLILIKPEKRHNIKAYKAMTVILAHEMVHVRQQALGTLKYTKSRVPLWKGKRYSKDTPYLDTPWEIEAFAKQELIMRRAIEV